MAYGTPADPVGGTVATVAYMVANVLDPIRALRAFTGNADPPGSGYVVTSDSTSATSWKTMLSAVLAALGYTPANKAGDTISGSLSFSNILQGIVLSGGSNVRDDHTAITGHMQILAHRGQLIVYDVRDTSQMLNVDDNTNTFTFKGQTVWRADNDGAGSGLDADLLDGLQGAAYAVAARGVPSGTVVWFETLAELTAAGAAWARYTAADGRLLVGAGTTFSQTFVEAANYGANWTPSSGLGATAGTLAGTTAAISATTQPQGFVNTDSPLSGGYATQPHGHPAAAVTISGAPALTGTSGVWLPPARAGVWGRKT